MPPVRRAGLAVLAILLTVTLPVPGHAGGEPDEKLPREWLPLAAPPSGNIVEFIRRLPHDPNHLGAPAAHAQVTTYPVTFRTERFQSLDGTPLAGSLAMFRDDKPRPGVVLVPGLTQIRNQKFLVEVGDLLLRNGWHVLAIDVRGQGESRTLSQTPISLGWKEADDILGAVRHLRETSKATSVSVIGFSNGGRSLVKAMARDGGERIAAGIAVTAPLGLASPPTRPGPGHVPTDWDRYIAGFLGAPEYEYFERAARWYGVDIPSLQARALADADIPKVKAPLLMLHTLDDFFWRGNIKAGRHDGGSFSLTYRDSVRDHPHVRTIVLDQGRHSGGVYLTDPHWFGIATMSYLKHWQARDAHHVTIAAPALDVLAEGTLDGQTVTYRVAVRNHGPSAVGPIEVNLETPDKAPLAHCWLGAEGLGRCAKDGRRLTWIVPRLPGNKGTAGLFGAVIDVSALSRGTFEATAWVNQPGTLAQQIQLDKR